MRIVGRRAPSSWASFCDCLTIWSAHLKHFLLVSLSGKRVRRHNDAVPVSMSARHLLEIQNQPEHLTLRIFACLISARTRG